DMDRVLVAFRRDEADLRALALDQRVRADGRAVRQHLDLPAELLEREAEALRGDLHRLEHPFGEVGRRGGRLRGGDAAVAVEHDAVGEGAADVDADEETGHLRVCRAGVRPDGSVFSPAAREQAARAETDYTGATMGNRDRQRREPKKPKQPKKPA